MIKFELNNGIKIPAVGLGTWKSSEEDAYKAVKWAIENGYKHIDTAAIYGNEAAVGKGIKDSGVDRSELFVTTKVWNSNQGYEKTLEAFQDSIDKLGVEYIDLYLIHWFKGYENLLGTWKAMEELYNKGLVKAIGVSNFNVHHLMYLLDHATVKPVINQVETHVGLQNHFLQEYCMEQGIYLEAYAPLMSWKVKELLENEVLINVAKKYGKTVPQVAVRWLVQRNIIALPKSVNEERIKANFDVWDFELDQSDMDEIRKLNNGTKLFPEFDNVDF